MIIDVIDMEDPGLGSNRREWLAYLGADSVRMNMYGMSNGVGQMISDIIRGAGACGRIEVLRIWSHGGPGMQNVSAGASGSGATHWAAISTSNISQMSDTLSRLTFYFAPRARVELRGCNVAQGSDGERLLAALARLWGVSVQAGTVVQETGRWSGPVVQSDPEGNFSCVMGSPVGSKH